MRAPWLALQCRLSAHYRRWLLDERENFGGFLIDEYGEERFTFARARAVTFECLCGLLLSVATYVSLEGMFFSFSALEFLLGPLTRDMVFIVSTEDVSAFWYILRCFLPCTLNITTLKTTLMPLYLAPLYLICVLLFPILHLLVGYSSCVRILSGMRSGSLPHATVLRQLVYTFAVQLCALCLIHQYLLNDEPELLLAEEVSSTGGAILALALSPALTIISFCMEPVPSEIGNSENYASSARSAVAPEFSKRRSVVGLLGLLIGGAYAGTARIYLESVIVFGAAPSLWSRLVHQGLDAKWIPIAVCVLVPCVFVYYAVVGSVCMIRRLHRATQVSLTEEGDSVLSSNLFAV
jgi:hypothetical protein